MRKRSHRTRTTIPVANTDDVVRYERSEDGLGRLEVGGQPTLTMRYRVDVEARVSENNGGIGCVHGRLRVVGRVIPDEPWTLVAYVGVATLVLEDGRRWACRVVDIGGRLADEAADPPFTVERRSQHQLSSV